MSLSVFSRFSACRSSLVKLLSGKEADCKVDTILLLSGFITAKFLYSGKMVVFGQKWLYSGKGAVFGQK